MDKLLCILRAAGLLDSTSAWIAAESRLCFVGDFFDRGTNGLETVDLIMRLQQQAATAGGEVMALLGNHELLLLAAHRFQSSTTSRDSFMHAWLSNGGQPQDLRGLTPTRIRWLERLPVLVVIGRTLLAHCDSDSYLAYGRTIRDIDAGIHQVVGSNREDPWWRLLQDFSDRHTFDRRRPGGTERARAFLSIFQADRLIHGHTPIDTVTGRSPAEIDHALVYADGLCVNVDGGMYRGGPGFVYETTIES